MILVIDNYDSFTYNLVHLLEAADTEVLVRRNDEVSIEQIRDLAPDGIILSPGPGRPAEAGVTPHVVGELGEDVPLLGVCLGHQAIGEVLGGKVVPAPQPVHGKTSLLKHSGEGVFRGLPDTFVVTRYHSLVLDPASLPPRLQPTAWADDGTLMGVRHLDAPIEGVQFHPESILSEHGAALISNWLRRVRQSLPA